MLIAFYFNVYVPEFIIILILEKQSKVINIQTMRQRNGIGYLRGLGKSSFC
jgi:hypothetical protein